MWQLSLGKRLPTPSRDEMLRWALGSYEQVNFVRVAQGFKGTGLLLDLDGNEDGEVYSNLQEAWQTLNIAKRPNLESRLRMGFSVFH